VHVAFVSALLIVFPFSKLMHMGGVFLSPTRNLPNNSREVRHVNPWNRPGKYRSYAEYEDEFRGVMAEAGLPLEKAPDTAP
jgi:nitrate reductase gamma subunit